MALVLFMDVNFQGGSYTVLCGQNVPALPPPIAGAPSSMQSDCQQWLTLWESNNYDSGNDSWWLQAPGPGKYWSVSSFVSAWRPHGNNNWNDRIHAVSFSGPPSGDVDNQIWWFADGHVGGNTGILLRILGEKYAETLSNFVRLVDGPMPAPPPSAPEQPMVGSGIKFKL